MNHYRSTDPGTNHHKPPTVIGRPLSPVYTVLQRMPQLPGDPEHAVARGDTRAELVALFYKPEDASEYARWKNQP